MEWIVGCVWADKRPRCHRGDDRFPVTAVAAGFPRTECVSVSVSCLTIIIVVEDITRVAGRTYPRWEV